MKPKTIKLKGNERIIAVVPETCHGPGWANAVVWVYIAEDNSKLRCECIQPDERTPEMHTLFSAGEAMVNALLSAVPTLQLTGGAARSLVASR
jgi:hypothetical protein